MRKRILFAAALAAVLIPATALAAQVIAAGTTMDTKLNVALDTKTSYVGQPISLTVQAPYPEDNPAFENAKIYGHVTSVVSGGQGRNPQMSIALDSIRYPQSGSDVRLNAQVTGFEKVHKNKVASVAGATLAGMVAGNSIGKWLGIGGVGPGAVGAAAGYLLSSNNKANFHVPAGSDVGVKLINNLAVR